MNCKKTPCDKFSFLLASNCVISGIMYRTAVTDPSVKIAKYIKLGLKIMEKQALALL